MEWLHALTVNSLDIIAVLDQSGIVRYESPSLQRVLGWQPKEIEGHNALEIIHPDDRAAVGQLLAENISNFNAIVTTSYRCQHKNGSWRILESIATNLLHDPVIRGIVINSRDITDRIEHELALRESEERFFNAFQYAAIGMALVSLEGQWLQVNQSVCKLLGYSEEELAGMTFQQVTHPDDLRADMDNLNRLLAGEVPYYHMKKRYFHKQGLIVWIQLAVSLVRDAGGEPLHFIAQINDITENRRAEEQLLHDALHDHLTGLANRTLLANHIEIAFNRFLRHPKETFALIMADLDRFKNINDTLGHPVGDLVLLETAKRFRACIKNGDLVARLGGDEFAILIEDLEDDNTPTRIVECLLQAMAEPIAVNNILLESTVSLGVVVVTPNHTSTDEIIRDADIALYRAKAAGRNSCQIFDQEMHNRIRERMELEHELRRAVHRGEMLIYLQPIVSLVTGKISSFEALLRWKHPTRGMIPPDVFIPIAEDTNLIHVLGAWVTRQVCRTIKTWPHGEPPPISINASPSEITKPRTVGAASTESANAGEDFHHRIERIAREENVAPEKLRIEITESVVISEPEYAMDVLAQLVDKGFQLLLDDFGAGYSSLSYLHDLPFYQVKLDRAFTAKLAPDNRSYELMRGIITLAHNMGIEVVAEGIETEDHLRLIRKAGCDKAQGYYISRPVSIEEAYDLYQTQTKW